MFGLIGVVILTVMLAVLSVATEQDLSDYFSVLNSTPAFFGMPFLVMIATGLIILSQQSTFYHRHVNQSLFSAHSSILNPAGLNKIWRVLYYAFMLLLLTLLVTGSGWQALRYHQQSESRKVTQTMRVTAWVTIEGISDSLYDVEGESGYRQIATVRAISPLINTVTAQALEKLSVDYLEQYPNTADPSEYRILLNAYPNNKKKTQKLERLNQLKPGDQLLMSLTLAPLKSSNDITSSTSGFDSYRWLRSRHVDGVATIMAMGSVAPTSSVDSVNNNAANVTDISGKSSISSTSLLYPDSYLQRFRLSIDKGRWQLRQHFYQGWTQYSAADQQARAVTLSLLTGDRSLISSDTKALYQLAGISHLLAISGTHVLFLAIVLAGLTTLLVDKKWAMLYRIIPRWQIRWWVMIIAAFIYALFTGFDVPAARTAWMLLAIGLVRLSLLPVSTLRVLLAMAVIMAWQDPYVLWQAGYWLSFIAVALLLKYDDATHLQNKNKESADSSQSLLLSRFKSQFKQLLKLQCWLFLALLPITLLLFGKASLWGLLINLFAIGLFGWVIVPLNLLAGLCYLIAPMVADGIWALVSAIVAGMHSVIQWLTALPALDGAWLYTPINTAMIIMVVLLALPWLMPRGLVSRWLALPPLALLMMTVSANQQALSRGPILYVLPTGDHHITAAVLSYPTASMKDNGVTKTKGEKSKLKPVYWLFLADHRPQGARVSPSSLTHQALSASLEQQLLTLSIERLEGIIIQTPEPALSAFLSDTVTDHNQNSKKQSGKGNTPTQALLPMTVLALIQQLSTHQYWQAGRSEQWSTWQSNTKKSIASLSKSSSAADIKTITVQPCEYDKTWQSPNGELSLRALTGWRQIDDESVWDCALTIDSQAPITVVQYNGNAPNQSPALVAQNITAPSASAEQRLQPQPSRLILDVSTHPRVWQLWSLLCDAKPFSISNSLDYPTVWLSHSSTQVSTDILTEHHVNSVMTYDNQPLEAALSVDSNF